MSLSKKVIAIAGPTGVGKTAFAIDLALQYNTEIISFDSRQIYKELKIGVARPSEKELSSVKHHMIASHSILDPINVACFEQECIDSLNHIFQTKDVVILCGGTGLFLNAVRFGLDAIPPISSENTQKAIDFIKNNTNQAILDLLNTIDFNLKTQIDTNNLHRVQRIIEVFFETGQSILTYRSGQPKKRAFDFEVIILNRSREDLYQRINQRVDLMLGEGLENEVASLKSYFHLQSLNTVGYKEWQPYFEGLASKNEVVEKIKQHSRNYAKRQITWFKKFNKEDRWIEL
jgi:tRNA dimethylallyltransferase